MGKNLEMRCLKRFAGASWLVVGVLGFIGCAQDPLALASGNAHWHDGNSGGESGGHEAAVAACEASVDAVRAACATQEPNNDRLCVYDKLRPLCATGRTAFVKAVFDCLKADTCQTPSDPSAAGDCVQHAIHSAATTEDHEVGALICACSNDQPNCDSDEPAYSLADLMLLQPGDVESIATCLAGHTCDDNAACVDSTPLAPALKCEG